MTRTEFLAVAKPILSNTQMVRAILDDHKTATRRVIKYNCPTNPESTLDDFIGKGNPQLLVGCAPYKTGDILYVRETWCWCPCWDCGMSTEKGCCDDIANKFYNDQRKETGCYGYRASFETGELPFDKWHTSIHMPKEAARLFLRVNNVRVERLQDMNGTDLEREGIKTGITHFKSPFNNFGNAERFKEAQEKFSFIWNSTIKKSDLPLYGWDANPWVWVIEFERVND